MNTQKHLLNAMRQQASTLVALGQFALTASLEHLFDETVTRVAQVLQADYCKILRFKPDDNEILLISGVGWQPGLVGQATVGTDLDSQAGYTLVSDRPVVVEDLTRETRFHGPALLRDHQVISGISVVIRGRKQPFGVLGVHTTHRRIFTQDDIDFVAGVANILAAAAEQNRTDHALDASEARYRTITRMVTDYAYVACLEPDGVRVEWQSGDLAARLGYSVEHMTPAFWSTIIHPDDMPIYHQYLIDNRVKDKNAHYQIRVYDAQRRIHWLHINSLMIVENGGEVIYGAIVDITEQKQAEEAIQRHADRLRVLTQVTRAFALASIHYEELLSVVVRRLVDVIGDTCFVLLFSEDLSLYTSAAYYSSDTQVLDTMYERMGFDYLPANSKTTQHIKTTGQSMFVPDLTPELFQTLVRPEVTAAFAHAMPKSMIAMPLRARDRLIGTLYLLRHEPDKPPYSVEDLAALEVLADRAALAVSNARLYKEVHNSESLFRSIFEQAAVGISHVDLHGRFIRVNRRLCEIVRYPCDELLKRAFQDITHPDDLQKDLDFMEGLLKGNTEPYTLEKRYLRPDGTSVWVNITVSLVHKADGEPDYFIAVVEDIDTRKQAEDEVLRLNAELEQRVIERTAHISAINKELEAFSYSVSHDLRTPLRALDGFSLALLEDYGDIVDEEGRFYLRRIREASQRMGELIDDLLNLSRLTRSHLKITEVHLSEIVHEILTELQQTQPERRAEFIIQPGLTAWGDSRLLRIMLDNLLGNAWKFTGHKEHSRIEFGISVYNSQMCYFVRDNGAGFDMTYAAKLFGAFQRLHNADEFEGSGLGLATVQRIIHRHGGQIWAEGAAGEGAVFYFTLSAVKEERYEQD